MSTDKPTDTEYETFDLGDGFFAHRPRGPVRLADYGGSVNRADLMKLRQLAQAVVDATPDDMPSATVAFAQSVTPQNVLFLLDALEAAWQSGQHILSEGAVVKIAQSIVDLRAEAHSDQLKRLLLTIGECVAAYGSAKRSASAVRECEGLPGGCDRFANGMVRGLRSDIEIHGTKEITADTMKRWLYRLDEIRLHLRDTSLLEERK